MEMAVNRNFVFADYLEQHSRTIPDQPAFVFLSDGEQKSDQITFEGLNQQSYQLSVQLKDFSGKRALLFYNNPLEFIKGIFGCLRAGVVAVPVPVARKNQKLSRLEAIVKDADPSLFLTESSLLDSVEWLNQELGNTLSCLATDQLIQKQMDKSWYEKKIDLQHIAFLQYTSGSTAQPKGIMVTHQNLLANVRAIQKVTQLEQHDVTVSWLPYYHDMGLIGGLFTPIYAGAKSVIMPPAAFLQKPIRWLQAISRYQAVASSAPDFAYAYCAEKIPESALYCTFQRFTCNEITQIFHLN